MCRKVNVDITTINAYPEFVVVGTVIKIMPAGNVPLSEEQELCTPISIKQSDFCDTFDQKERAWIARWMWAMNANQLHNVIPDDAVSKKNRAEFKEELQLWISNGWLIQYLQEWLVPLSSPRD